MGTELNTSPGRLLVDRVPRFQVGFCEKSRGPGPLIFLRGYPRYLGTEVRSTLFPPPGPVDCSSPPPVDPSAELFTPLSYQNFHPPSSSLPLSFPSSFPPHPTTTIEVTPFNCKSSSFLQGIPFCSTLSSCKSTSATPSLCLNLQ